MATFFKYFLHIIAQLKSFLNFHRQISNKKEIIKQKEDLQRMEKNVKQIIKEKSIPEINYKFGWKE